MMCGEVLLFLCEPLLTGWYPIALSNLLELICSLGKMNSAVCATKTAASFRSFGAY